jgi:hypothetical protein
MKTLCMLLLCALFLLQCKNSINPVKDQTTEQTEEQGTYQTEKQFLVNISGIWQESILGDKVYLDCRGDSLLYNKFSSKKTRSAILMIVKNYDAKNKTICLDGQQINHPKVQITICFRQVFSVDGKTFYIVVDDSSISAPYKLSFVRKLDN